MSSPLLAILAFLQRAGFSAAFIVYFGFLDEASSLFVVGTQSEEVPKRATQQADKYKGNSKSAQKNRIRR